MSNTQTENDNILRNPMSIVRTSFYIGYFDTTNDEQSLSQLELQLN